MNIPIAAIRSMVVRDTIAKPWSCLYVLVCVLINASSPVALLAIVIVALVSLNTSTNLRLLAAHNMAYTAPGYREAEFIKGIVTGIFICAILSIVHYVNVDFPFLVKFSWMFLYYCTLLFFYRYFWLLLFITVIFDIAIKSSPSLAMATIDATRPLIDLNIYSLLIFTSLSTSGGLALIYFRYKKTLTLQYDITRQPAKWKTNAVLSQRSELYSIAEVSGLLNQVIEKMEQTLAWYFYLKDIANNKPIAPSRLITWGIVSRIAPDYIFVFGLLWILLPIYFFGLYALSEWLPGNGLHMAAPFLGLTCAFLWTALPYTNVLHEQKQTIAWLGFLSKFHSRKQIMWVAAAAQVKLLAAPYLIWLLGLAILFLTWPQYRQIWQGAAIASLIYFPWMITFAFINGIFELASNIFLRSFLLMGCLIFMIIAVTVLNFTVFAVLFFILGLLVMLLIVRRWIKLELEVV